MSSSASSHVAHAAPLRVVIPVAAGIGNALMAVPMVRQLKRHRPGARITVLARLSAMADVFRRQPEVDEVLVTGSGLKANLRYLAWTRQRRPDVYLVPFPSNRWQYSLLSLTSGAPRRIIHSYPVGYWRAMHFLVRNRVPAEPGIHDVRQNLRLLERLEIDPDLDDAPVFPINDDDRRRADALLEHAGFPATLRPIVIHAGSGRTVVGRVKRWPVENYADLIAQLHDELGPRLVLVEGPDEAGVSDEILSALARRAGPDGIKPYVAKLTGPLGDSAALLERAELYVGSDSGLGHLAAAVGTRPVTLFAPADPDRVCPFGYRDLVVQAPTSCAPCHLYPWKAPYPKACCVEPYCIGTISVPSVLATVRRALTSSHILPQASSART